MCYRTKPYFWQLKSCSKIFSFIFIPYEQTHNWIGTNALLSFLIIWRFKISQNKKELAFVQRCCCVLLNLKSFHLFILQFADIVTETLSVQCMLEWPFFHRMKLNDPFCSVCLLNTACNKPLTQLRPCFVSIYNYEWTTVFCTAEQVQLSIRYLQYLTIPKFIKSKDLLRTDAPSTLR